MSTPNPVGPGRKTQREEEEKRRRDVPEQPGKPRQPEIDRPRDLPEETEEDWSKTPR